MAASCILPREILAQIFRDEVLSDSDIFNALQACRLFRENIQYCAGRRCTLIIDRSDCQAWKFARCLLKNPELGEQFLDIKVEWERRYLGCQYNIWSWTPEEQAQIISICENWNINEKIRGLILGGRNSESLLPFILCLTPRLKSLDLGCPDAGIFRFFDDSDDENCKLALECLGFTGVEPGCRDLEPHMSLYYGPGVKGEYFRVVEEHESDYILFFIEYLWDSLGRKEKEKVPKLPPGFRSLQHFTTGKPIDRSFNDTYLFLLLRCPRIESVDAPFPAAKSYMRYKPEDLVYDPPSTLKRLKLTPALDIRREKSNLSYYSQYLQNIARVPSNLEWVYINSNYNTAERSPAMRKVEEEVGNAFLQHHRNTLKFSEILINGGGFDEDGKFRFDEERRRDVLHRQRAFELVSKGLQDLRARPSLIMALRAPILSRIIDYLTPKDRFNLLLSNKLFYDVCYRRIRSTIDIHPQTCAWKQRRHRFVTRGLNGFQSKSPQRPFHWN